MSQTGGNWPAGPGPGRGLAPRKPLGLPAHSG